MNDQTNVDALLRAWEAFSDSLETGFEFGLDDYLNDVDARQLIANALAQKSTAGTQAVGDKFDARLQAADDRVRANTEMSGTCLWGTRNEEKNGWTADDNWWYYAVPREREREFNEDLEHVR
ncbi:MAG: hypothetical protein AB8H80_18180 [Planctomycetota bacterium]